VKIEVTNVAIPLKRHVCQCVVICFAEDETYQTTQMAMAMFNGHRIFPSVNIRWYCRMIETLINTRLMLYAMIDQNRYCQQLERIIRRVKMIRTFSPS
jgi:hypothetical protein